MIETIFIMNYFKFERLWCYMKKCDICNKVTDDLYACYSSNKCKNHVCIDCTSNEAFMTNPPKRACIFCVPKFRHNKDGKIIPETFDDLHISEKFD